MKVLIITGDKKFGPGHERYELQRSVVDELAVVYWGRGSYWPKLPKERFDVVTTQDPFWRGPWGVASTSDSNCGPPGKVQQKASYRGPENAGSRG